MTDEPIITNSPNASFDALILAELRDADGQPVRVGTLDRLDPDAGRILAVGEIDDTGWVSSVHRQGDEWGASRYAMSALRRKGWLIVPVDAQGRDIQLEMDAAAYRLLGRSPLTRAERSGPTPEDLEQSPVERVRRFLLAAGPAGTAKSAIVRWSKPEDLWHVHAQALAPGERFDAEGEWDRDPSMRRTWDACIRELEDRGYKFLAVREIGLGDSPRIQVVAVPADADNLAVPGSRDDA